MTKRQKRIDPNRSEKDSYSIKGHSMDGTFSYRITKENATKFSVEVTSGDGSIQSATTETTYLVAYLLASMQKAGASFSLPSGRIIPGIIPPHNQ